MLTSMELVLLIVVYHTTSGLTLTNTLTAPSYDECDAARPAIVEMAKDAGVVKFGGKMLPVLEVKGYCISLEKDTTPD